MSVKDAETGDPLFPSWQQLLERAVERLQEENQASAEVVSALVKLGPKEYLEAARRAREGLAGQTWFNFLKVQLDISSDRATDVSLGLARSIWELGSSLIITTNYDRVMHWACPDLTNLSPWDIDAPVEQLETPAPTR